MQYNLRLNKTRRLVMLKRAAARYASHRDKRDYSMPWIVPLTVRLNHT